ncbi:Zn2-C6 fungal-type DNA-binding domain [Fusarium oxysporum f. sp. vasinfectum]|uniref:Zn(2)-C6 fungal-type domain-containing protein n=1 Tax=Fusarium oxysporum f. sp. vasinfectum 25433 TaxID=1089449 RepID=X0KZV8_FUSOX|nr:hypothetical protein FOTG_17358 [Fusarium oxysporum f. sp. vasinfectum 25433]KAK2933504.1 Zn2-C6 fungal-type DNA-binding domain [Fusarium oxysporum f. sp. vasinfectum]
MPNQSRSEPTQRSCAVCHRRKVRCDKRTPCSQCTRSNFPCSYPAAGPITRRARKTTINDVASRIEQMEKTIETFALGKASIASPSEQLTPNDTARISCPPETEAREERRSDDVLLNKGTVSHYVNEVLFSRAIQQEQDVRTALATPRSESPPSVIASPFNPMGILSNSSFPTPLASLHPPKRTAMKLWKVFVESVDACEKVLHIPTSEVLVYKVLQDPSKASAEDLGLCFSVYYAAAIALPPDEADHVLEEERTQSLHRYKVGLEQALAQADFLENPTLALLHAVAIYLAALRAHNSGRSVWIINGLALRAAQSIGLHRDGKKLGLSPFESEIRRRLWCKLLPHVQCRPPRNLHDNDLIPEMTELPPARADWTRMTLVLVNTEVARAWAQLSRIEWASDNTPGEDFRAKIISGATFQVESILDRCNPIVPEQRMTLQVSRTIIRKFDIVTRRQWQTLRAEDQAVWATEASLLEALSVLEDANALWEDGDLRAFHWITTAYPEYHMILFILRHLCVCPRGPSVGRAFDTVERHLERARIAERGYLRGMKWTVLATLKDRAMSLRQRAETEDDVAAEAWGVRVKDGDCPPGDGAGDVFGGAQQAVEQQELPDWGMVLQEFQMDLDNFSMIF